MLEQLFPLQLPAGYVNNGTTYQSKGRWFTGNLVRFFQGTIQPIGGWVARSPTGATITGVPNCAHAWQTNDGVAYLAIGTTDGLFVVDASDVITDITPSVASGYAGSLRWQLTNFGSYLVGCFNLDTFDTAVPINAIRWTGDTSTIAASLDTSDVIPSSVYGLVTTPERFLVLLRGADPTAGATLDTGDPVSTGTLRKPPGVTLDPGSGSDGTGLRFPFVP